MKRTLTPLISRTPEEQASLLGVPDLASGRANLAVGDIVRDRATGAPLQVLTIDIVEAGEKYGESVSTIHWRPVQLWHVCVAVRVDDGRILINDDIAPMVTR